MRKKDQFYEELQNAINNAPKADQLFLMDDFNAGVGTENKVWPTCLRPFGLQKINENDQRLLEFCTNNNLCITNTFYSGKDRHRVSWYYPKSRHWHQIDFIILRKKDANMVKQTRSFYSADCNTDHLLVIAKAKILTKKTSRAEEQKKPKINIRNTKDPVKGKISRTC
ncbi:craniofacial development protein 2-like [Aplysia californica]|uniref:Craniofacial development protein 2-like n=1 Tax=Aplysia californica TaxID=6500 RepID=A0ABM0K1K6_APLCA|nr:craniofacial development protein 2-like [Aplysia californica]